MGFFSFLNKQSTPEAAKPATDSTNDKMHSFSTPFLNIGGENLGKPFVSPYYTVSGIIQFGANNLYPQILDQMYYTSAIHGSCIDFITNACVGGGYEYGTSLKNGKEQVDIYTFERTTKFKKLVRNITRDFLIHRRICILITKDPKTGKFKSMKRINPSYIRNDMKLEKFIYCNDWSRRTSLIEYPRYTANRKDKESLYIYQAESIGQDVYPLPTYISVLNDAFLDGEIAYFQKSNIQNAIWPSITVRVPKTLDSQEERDAFKDGLISKSGAANAGKIMVLTGNGIDNVPIVESLRMNENDKLFDSTIESIMNKICIAHGINPSIMGIKVTGSLGNAQELQMSYGIFEKNIILPLRNEMTEVFDDILDIAGISNTIIINNFQIIDNTIAEVPSIEQSIGKAVSSAMTKNKKA